jgi:hypothetical protein
MVGGAAVWRQPVALRNRREQYLLDMIRARRLTGV